MLAGPVNPGGSSRSPIKSVRLPTTMCFQVLSRNALLFASLIGASPKVRSSSNNLLISLYHVSNPAFATRVLSCDCLAIRPIIRAMSAPLRFPCFRRNSLVASIALATASAVGSPDPFNLAAGFSAFAVASLSTSATNFSPLLDRCRNPIATFLGTPLASTVRINTDIAIDAKPRDVLSIDCLYWLLPILPAIIALSITGTSSMGVSLSFVINANFIR